VKKSAVDTTAADPQHGRVVAVRPADQQAVAASGEAGHEPLQHPGRDLAGAAAAVRVLRQACDGGEAGHPHDLTHNYRK
jgi:hypothetical protein